MIRSFHSSALLLFIIYLSFIFIIPETAFGCLGSPARGEILARIRFFTVGRAMLSCRRSLNLTVTMVITISRWTLSQRREIRCGPLYENQFLRIRTTEARGRNKIIPMLKSDEMTPVKTNDKSK